MVETILKVFVFSCLGLFCITCAGWALVACGTLFLELVHLIFD